MDLQDHREIADALLSTKGDVVKRQHAALRRLQTLISGGVYPGQLLPLVAQLVSSSQAPDLRREAAQALGGALGSPEVRERCSAFGELLSTLWGAIGEVGEPGAHAVLAALASLAPEDAARVLLSAEPDALVRRATDHRIPAVRPHVLQALGEMAVRAWPFAAAGQDVSLRDACVDVLRLIFGRLSAEASPPNIRIAAAAVLDALMKAYLNIEPASLAPVALLHVGWSFAPVYATLLVELSHDLEPALPVLCAGPGTPPLADESCLWVPAKEDAGGPRAPADLGALVAEAAALRAGLLWILVHSGGLARKYPEESADRTGSLIFELVREVTSSSKEPPVPRPMHEQELPSELRAALFSAASLEGDSWGIRFARSRASLMLAVLEIARGALGSAVGMLLATADALARACRGSTGSQTLQRFVAEALCSIAALWPLLGSEPPGVQREHFARICAEAVSAAAVFHRARAGQVPARLQQLTLLATRGLVWAVVRPGPPPDLQALFGEPLGGLRELPGALAAALCTECARALGHDGQAEKQAARSLAENLIRTLSPRLFAEAAAPADGAATAADRASAAQAAAGCWCLLSLAAAAQASALLGPISDALLGASQLQGSPAILAMLLATLRDLGALGLVAGASRASQALQGHAAGSVAEMAAYLDLLAREVRSPGTAAPLSARLATPLCAPAGAPLESSMWLHSLAGEGAAGDGPGGPVDGLARRAMSVSGPPLMVYVRLLPSWPCRGCSHVVLRIDIYNVTGLIYRNIKVEMGIGISSRMGARDEEQLPYSFAGGLARPCATTLETLTTREKVTVWRELRLSALQPVCATVLISYENASPETAGGAATSSPQAAAADVWSDDEDEENFVLEFACKPCALPLSVFFAPFHGFDAPAGDVFPPPVMFAACPHSRVEQAAESCLPDLLSWSPPGFHRIDRAGRLPAVPDVQAAFAASAFDGETVVCLLYRGDGPAPQQLEARSNSEAVLRALMDNLLFWVMATDC